MWRTQLALHGGAGDRRAPAFSSAPSNLVVAESEGCAAHAWASGRLVDSPACRLAREGVLSGERGAALDRARLCHAYLFVVAYSSKAHHGGVGGAARVEDAHEQHCNCDAYRDGRDYACARGALCLSALQLRCFTSVSPGVAFTCHLLAQVVEDAVLHGAQRSTERRPVLQVHSEGVCWRQVPALCHDWSLGDSKWVLLPSSLARVTMVHSAPWPLGGPCMGKLLCSSTCMSLQSASANL